MDGGSSDSHNSNLIYIMIILLLITGVFVYIAVSNNNSNMLLVIIFVVFVVTGGYFASAESAYSAMDKIKIKSRADSGDKRARIVLFISNNFDRALTTLLIGNNITHIAAGSVAALITARMFADQNGNVSSDISIYSTFIATGIVFLFSEMIPKSIANDRANTTSLLWAGSLKFLMKVFKPLASFFMAISNLVTRLFTKDETPTMTEEELIDMLDTAEDEGVMDEDQTDLIKSAFMFSDNDAEDVMTMRDDIFAVNIRTSKKEIINALTKNNHSRIPVYDGVLDNLVGILNIRTFFRQYKRNPNFSLRSILSPVFYVSKSDKIDELLTQMRQQKNYIAIVTEPYDDNETLKHTTDNSKGSQKASVHGKVVGLVSIEDFLEELVGEIWDEDDIVDENFMKIGGNKFQVNAALTLSDALSRIGIVYKNKNQAKKTVSEWVREHFENMPEEDDSFVYDNIEVSIDEINDDGKLTRVIFHILDEEELAEIMQRNTNADTPQLQN